MKHTPTIIVLDTETINLQNPFVYELGYVIYDPTADKVLVQRDNLVREVYKNRLLFTCAFYNDRKAIYEAEKTPIKKWAKILKQLARDLKDYNVQEVWAFNSRFDMKAIAYTAEHIKSKNPLTAIEDIRPLAKTALYDNEYVEFCEEHGFLTNNNYPKTTAESYYCYLTKDPEFKEAHRALDDSMRELCILNLSKDSAIVPSI